MKTYSFTFTIYFVHAIKKENIPGHGLVPQTSILLPGQLSPPFSGVGLSQFLVRVFSLQSDTHSLQGLQPPLTQIKRIIL